MADRSKIEWTDATWNPITGCSVVSPGCTNCYAMKLAGGRMQHHWSRSGLTRETKAGPVWNGQVRFNEPWLDQPLGWKRPRTIFVCAHGDLFHESVPVAWIERVFAVMGEASQHRFQVLTKRPQRMLWFMKGQTVIHKHVWLGVSAEDQKRAEERIPPLLDTPAAVRFVSAEPLLGPVDIGEYLPVPHPLNLASTYVDGDGVERLDISGARIVGLDWVVGGGESGPGARPMHPDWPRAIRDRCGEAGVPFFFKQHGEWATYRDVGGVGWSTAQRFDRRGDPVGPWQGRIHAPAPAKLGEFMFDGKAFESRMTEDWNHILMRLGKKRAGRTLDGRTWDEMPEVPAR